MSIKIGYCKTFDDQILIESISGVLTLEEIQKNLSEEVLRLYIQGNSAYLKDDSNKYGIITFEKDYHKKFEIIEIGDIYSKERFDEIIEFIKRCGLRLKEVQKKVKEYTHYVIEI